MDLREGGYSDSQRVWSQLPSGSCESFAEGFEAKLAQTPKRRAFQRNEEAIETTGKRRSGLL
jgi:hypothetical protein